MKCEQVQELFPELQENPESFPEAREHLDGCLSCKTLFHIFEGFSDDAPVSIDPSKRDVNFMNIQKKMRRHDRVVFTRRIGTISAAIMLVFISIFSINQSPSISIADISDDVLYIQSQSSTLPEINLEQDEIIEYLVQYENIEFLGELF